MSLFSELRRRNVFRVAIAYIVAGWLLLQLTEVLTELLALPEIAGRFVVLIVIIGFPLALIFAWAFELTPEGIRREHEVDRARSITAQTGRKLDFIIIGILAVAVLMLLADRFWLSGIRTPPVEVAGQESTPDRDGGDEVQRPAPPNSIAVLPFANMSEDPGNEYFSDGISEEILNALAQVDGLKVAGRTSSFAFKGRNEDLRLIGETLGVNHILEGSVRKAGNTVRVTAQLVQVEDGFHLWSDTWDRELTDIFAIQDEIAGAIISELESELVGVERVSSSRTGTEAYEKYLLAKQRIYSRKVPEMEQAVDLLDEVIELDPGFAPAWAQRGIVTLLLSDTEYGNIPYEVAMSTAHQNFTRALELDSELAEGWAGLGLYYDLQLGATAGQTGIRHLEKALAINPNLINASNWLQNALMDQNRVPEALAILEDVFERDPLYRPVINNLLQVYGRMRRFEEAEAVLERVRPFFRGERTLANAEALFRIRSGKPGEALAWAKQAYEIAPNNQASAETLAEVQFYLHEFDKALEIKMSDPWIRILVLNHFGRTEEAAMLARDRLNINPTLYISLLADQQEFAALIEHVESAWPGLQALYKDLGHDFGYGAWLMQDVALAYRATGQDGRFREAMAYARSENDMQREFGIETPDFAINQAEYWTLAGDQERAMAFVEEAVELGLTFFDLAGWWPVLKPLDGDPRFEEAQRRARENLAQQRAIAGLEPLKPDYSL